MRNIQHHSILITCNKLDLLKQIRTKVLELFKLNMEAGNAYKLVGEPIESLINNYHSLAIFPDGSKEGHETSEDGDMVRKKVIDHLLTLKKSDPTLDLHFVEVYFGNDNGEAKIVSFG